MNTKVLKLINDYLTDVETFMSCLQQEIGNLNPLEAIRKNKIEKEGILNEDNKIYYSFHGRGCVVKIKERIIDFDFGSNFRHDVFDVWRLSIYAESRKDDFGECMDKKILEREFNSLVKQGIILKDTYEYEDLYYLH